MICTKLISPVSARAIVAHDRDATVPVLFPTCAGYLHNQNSTLLHRPIKSRVLDVILCSCLSIDQNDPLDQDI